MPGRLAICPVTGRDVPPDAFAVVMATGIVSIAARDHAYPLLDLALAGLATATFLLLVAVVVLRLFQRPRSTVSHTRRPDVTLRMFTFVAACTVLGARFRTDHAAAWAFAAAAAVAWLILGPLAVRDVWSRPRAELREHAHGAWLLASVATSGLAITAADLAACSRWPGWVALSAAAWILAVLLYLAITVLIGLRAEAGLAPEEVTPDCPRSFEVPHSC